MSAHQNRVVLAMLLVSLIASGCSTQARWVNCEGRLEPINRPAPKTKDAPSKVPAALDTKERTVR